MAEFVLYAGVWLCCCGVAYVVGYGRGDTAATRRERGARRAERLDCRRESPEFPGRRCVEPVGHDGPHLFRVKPHDVPDDVRTDIHR